MVAGSFEYKKAFGVRSMKEGETVLLDLEKDVLWLGSVTKILTSIAALQCVQEGHFTLDEDVTRIVPELKDLDVKHEPKTEGEEPTFTKATNTITLRQVHEYAGNSQIRY